MTAYRQDALRLAQALQQGLLCRASFAAATGVSKAAVMLRADQQGLVAECVRASMLTPKGAAARPRALNPFRLFRLEDPGCGAGPAATVCALACC